MSKVLILIPAYNEEQSIIGLLREIEGLSEKYDYVVINDCSSDNTLNLLKEYGAAYLNSPVNLGIGGAVQLGYKYAYEKGYDIAIQVDGDGQHDVNYLQQLISPIENGDADIVIGSRFVDKEGFQSTHARRTGIKILSGLIWLMCHKRVKDVTSGFRAVNRKYIEYFSDNYPDDYPEPEVIIASSLLGAKIEEVPVIMRERMGGISSINLWKSVYYMIKVSIAIVLCRLSLGFDNYKKE